MGCYRVDVGVGRVFEGVVLNDSLWRERPVTGRLLRSIALIGSVNFIYQTEASSKHAAVHFQSAELLRSHFQQFQI